MLRAPLSPFEKAVGEMAPEQAPVPEGLNVPSRGTAPGQQDDAVGGAESRQEMAVPVPNDVHGTMAPKRAGQYAARERFTVITAVYNVERYLDDFFTSLVNQSADFRSCVELIIVDDGSTDGSGEICRRWVESCPGCIRYYRQDNAGQGAARNYGLLHARTDWVTFIDPDDFVSQDYFELIDQAICKRDSNEPPLRLITTNLIFYRENLGNFRDAHPLRFRYAKGDAVLPASALGKHLVFSASCTFFWRQHLLTEGLNFDVRIKPAFEDGHLVNRYLISLEEADVAFLAGPKYYYRKRVDASSTIDTAWQHPGRYGDQLLYGYLDLIDYCLKRKGCVPVFVQRTLMYDLAWHFKRLINGDPPHDLLGKEAVDEYRRLLHAIMDHVSEDVILEFDHAGIWHFHKVGLLSRYKNTAPEVNVIYCEQYDGIKRLLELKYYSREETCAEEIRVDGSRVVPVYAKTRCHWMLEEPFVYERSLWIEVGDDGVLSVAVSSKPARISFAGKLHRAAASLHDIRFALCPRPVQEENLPREAAELRRVAREADTIQKYVGCWVLMDRDTQADDNAEHLYRFLMREHAEVNAFYVLRPESPDWARLSSEGFKLLEFDSDEHKLALLNADHLISSHADHYIFDVLSREHFGDLLRYRYTSLRHGVIHNDLSRWLNKKKIDCFVTTTQAEYDSIVQGRNYKFSAREVVLTGLPRHDRLLSLREEMEKMILIMPTWRRSLVGLMRGNGGAREINPKFHDSMYAHSWGSLLRSPELRELAEKEGYAIVFFPHPNIAPYIDGFNLPAYIKAQTHDGVRSIQHLFARAALMVTDYSSVAFELGFLGRPVIYFQFDSDSIFSGAHTTQKGYFDYERDGFGPVCRTAGEVVRHVTDAIQRQCVPTPEYQARMDRTFSLRDGRNCRRTYEAIIALDRAEIPESARRLALLEFARRTLAFGEWEDSHGAWQQLRGCDGVPESEALLSLVLCARKLGLTDACKAYMDEAESQGVDANLLLKEKSGVAVAQGEFKQALAHFNSWQCGNVLDPKDAAFIADIARAFRLTGDDQRAERLLLEAEEVSHPDIQWEWAELASLRQSWKEAAERWAPLVAANGMNHPEACLKCLEALPHLERAEEAHEILARLPWDGMPPEVTRQRAELAFRFLDWKMAVKAWSLLETVGELRPDEWLKFAKALRKRGEFDHAGQALDSAGDGADLRTLMQERALLLSAQNSWVEAMAAWQALMNRRDLGANRNGWLHLARAQMHVGELETALRTLMRFTRRKGDTKESLALRADIELAIEQAQSAAAPIMPAKPLDDVPSGNLTPGGVVHLRHEGVPYDIFVLDADDPIARHLRGGSFHELEALEQIRKHVPENASIVEVGANVGDHTVYFEKVLRCRSNIVFEPNPRAIRALQLTMQLNGLCSVDTSHLGIALSGQEGWGELPIPSDNLGAASCEPDAAGSIRYLPGDALLGGNTVDFIKIDVERTEMQVLAGMSELISRCKPMVFIGVDVSNEDAFHAWREREGYEIVESYRRCRTNVNYIVAHRE